MFQPQEIQTVHSQNEVRVTAHTRTRAILEGVEGVRG